MRALCPYCKSKKVYYLGELYEMFRCNECKGVFKYIEAEWEAIDND
jgi:transcription initiation factor TFIIIB Brf1 subunit/transcription initiation factor TFIIB